MKKLLGTALLVLLIAGCGESGGSGGRQPAGDKQAEKTPTPPAATPAPELDEHGHDLSLAEKEPLDSYSQGVRDYYGDEVAVGKTGDQEMDIEIEYHQPPRPAEAAVGDMITLTGTNIGVRLEVTVSKVSDVGDKTAVDLRLENTGIAVHDDAFRAAAVTYADGKTVEVEAEKEKCSNGFDGVVRLDVSFKARGCLVFPKSGNAEPERFQLALENVPTEAGGIWNLASSPRP
jgi:hypothetical protein